MAIFVLTAQEEKELAVYEFSFKIKKNTKKTTILETVIQGDSGGPLIYNGVQVGLTSFGAAIGCEAGENKYDEIINDYFVFCI